MRIVFNTLCVCTHEHIETGTLTVYAVHPPFPRAFRGKFHILFAHLRQLHLTSHILSKNLQYDVFFVDQLSTCIPFLRSFGKTRVLFYCHFPDKLLANGELIEEKLGRGDEVRFRMKKNGSLLKKAYRFPMDLLEEITTRMVAIPSFVSFARATSHSIFVGQADCILANSKFTSRVFKSYFASIPQQPIVVYPGINIKAYEAGMSEVDMNDSDVVSITSSVSATCLETSRADIFLLPSDRPTLVSMNRFEKKKNAALAVNAFALLRSRNHNKLHNLRLVLAGGYDPRLLDNDTTLASLVHLVSTVHKMSYALLGSKAPSSLVSNSSPPESSDVVFLLNFSTAQRTALLRSPSTLCLLYTPANEHFGIGPVEGLICGLPVLSCDSGGPVETLADGVGWLRPPDPEIWASALEEIVVEGKGKQAGERGKKKAREVFGMDVMASSIERELSRVVEMGRVESSWDWEWIRLFLGLITGLLLAWVARIMFL